MVDLPLGQARMRLRSLVRRAMSTHERTTVTDQGQPAAVLVNAEEVADLEEAAALAEYRAAQARGEQRMIPHEEALRRLNRPRSAPGEVEGTNTPRA